ncbi:MAG: hypothetical protein ACE5LB_01140 [Acidiferrobacterales bacterium]
MVYPRIPGRCRIRRVIPSFLATLFLTLGAAHSAADEPSFKRNDPVFFDTRPAQALVYFVNDLYAGEAHVYIDNTAIGILPWKSYTAVVADPGFRVVWGTSEARWYEFKPGWAYLLRLVKVGALSRAWVTDNPGIIGALVADKKLTYVTTQTDALARLQERAQHKYRDALKAAGAELALPYRRRLHALDLKGQPPASLQAER